MKIYPSIPKQVQDIPVYGFDKLDGSNIRVEWTQKTGFSKFGTRTHLLNPGEAPLGRAIPIFHDHFSFPLEKIFKKQKFDKVTCYLEFYGPNSFAGLHDENDDFSLSLFDVAVFKKGFMPPKDFHETFKDEVSTPKLLHVGNANQLFVDRVRNGELDGMTFEGVVCKSPLIHKNRQTMFKIKNQAWLNKFERKMRERPPQI